MTNILDNKKELEQKKKARLQNYREWLIGFERFFTQSKSKDQAALQKIHKGLASVNRLVYLTKAAELLNHKYWDIVSNYLRLSLKSNGAVDESKLINRYKVISATELTIMTIRPIIYEEDEDERVNEEIERFLNALLSWYIAIILIRSWENEEHGTTYSIAWKKKSNNNLKRISTFFEPAVRSEPVAINFRDEHIRWLAFVEPDSYIPVLSNAQTWRMFYFCLQALNNGMKDFSKKTATKSTRNPTNDNRGTSNTSQIRVTKTKNKRG